MSDKADTRLACGSAIIRQRSNRQEAKFKVPVIKAPDAALSGVVLKHWKESVPDDRMAHLVKDATRAFLRALQVRLAVHDVPLGMWTFLRILWDREGLTQRELSHAAGVMEPSTAIALRSMEERGYILREQKPGNRKNVYVFLTPTGRWLQSTLVPLAEEVNTIALAGIAAEDVASTRRALLAMLENLARDEQLEAKTDEAEAGEPAAPKSRSANVRKPAPRPGKQAKKDQALRPRGR
jgi:MarR family transcriptional regulator, organic hydroperoxide resistance regulator